MQPILPALTWRSVCFSTASLFFFNFVAVQQAGRLLGVKSRFGTVASPCHSICIYCQWGQARRCTRHHGSSCNSTPPGGVPASCPEEDAPWNAADQPASTRPWLLRRSEKAARLVAWCRAKGFSCDTSDSAKSLAGCCTDASAEAAEPKVQELLCSQASVK